MIAAQLEETTLDPKKRLLLKVVLLTDNRNDMANSVERLRGVKAESRFTFIQEKHSLRSKNCCTSNPASPATPYSHRAQGIFAPWLLISLDGIFMPAANVGHMITCERG